MRHRRGNKKLNKPTDQRIALLRGLVRSLVLHDRIQTTEARAKEARKLAEHVITLAKTDDVHSRRLVARIVGTERKLTPREFKQGKTKVDPIRRLFEEIGPTFKDREGGYTRITRIGTRRGDGSEMAVLELVQ